MGKGMRWADGFIAVDWGSTNRRAYLMDSGGKCLDEFEDDRGVLSIRDRDFPGAVTEIRERLGDKVTVSGDTISVGGQSIKILQVRDPK